MSEHTTLYRLFDKRKRLLYVGISGNPGRRFSQHAEDKLWWGDVVGVTLEHFETRDAAEEAERAAIYHEKPLHNVVHNRGQSNYQYRPGVYTFGYRSGGMRSCKLFLFPEIALEPCVEDLDDANGEEQFRYWVHRVRTAFPDEFERDAIPINWYVKGDCVFEYAPFQARHYTWDARHYTWDARHYTWDEREDFLTHYTWPHDDNARRVDWYSLSVRHDRFPTFVKALGWKPSALQPTCPLRSIFYSKNGTVFEKWIAA